MFYNKRLVLDKNQIFRPGRNNDFFWKLYFERKDSKSTNHKTLSLTEFKSRRQEMYSQITCALTKEQFYNYNGIDQENEGACSLVGFLNMINLENVPFSWKYKGHKFTKDDMMNFWGDIWYEIEKLSSSKDGMSDIAQMLDGCVSINLLTKSQIDSLQYVPIRSYGNAENSFNIMFTNDDNNVFRNIANYMKKLINGNQIFLVNSHEHTRVCVGYTETDFVFADSWGNNAHTTEKDPTGTKVNYIVAGYSFAPISMIASYVRDIVYWNRKLSPTCVIPVSAASKPSVSPPKSRILSDEQKKIETQETQKKPSCPVSAAPKASVTPPIDTKVVTCKPKVVACKPNPKVVASKASVKDCNADLEKLNYMELQSKCKTVRTNHGLETKELRCNEKRLNIIKNLCKHLKKS